MSASSRAISSARSRRRRPPDAPRQAPFTAMATPPPDGATVSRARWPRCGMTHFISASCWRHAPLDGRLHRDRRHLRATSYFAADRSRSGAFPGFPVAPPPDTDLTRSSQPRRTRCPATYRSLCVFAEVERPVAVGGWPGRCPRARSIDAPVPMPPPPRSAAARAAEHVEHLVAQRVAGVAQPGGGHRQEVEGGGLTGGERHEADAGHAETRRPARHDGQAQPGRHQLDDGLLLLGTLRRLGRRPARWNSLIVRSWLCGRELRSGTIIGSSASASMDKRRRPASRWRDGTATTGVSWNSIIVSMRLSSRAGGRMKAMSSRPDRSFGTRRTVLSSSN